MSSRTVGPVVSSSGVTLDARITELLATGDRAAAATEVLHVLGPEILRFLCRVSRDPDVADDMFGMFSEDLWSGIATYDGHGAVRRWAFRLAWHSACQYWEQAWNRKRRPLDDARYAAIAQELRSETRVYRRTETKEWLARLREELSPTDRALLVLRLEENLNLLEASETLGLSHEAARQRWSRLKRRLSSLAAKMLERQGE